MYSGKIELGDLPIYNEEERDQNVSCVKISGVKEEQRSLNNTLEENSLEDMDQNSSVEVLNDVPHTLSWFYAQVLIVITSTAILIELSHEHLPLFYMQDYLILYLLTVGILLLVGAYISKFRERFMQVHIRDLVKRQQYLSKKLVGEVNKLDIDQFLKTGIHAFGLVVVVSNGLEVISTIISYNHCLTAMNAACTVLRCIFIGFQVAFFLMSSKEIWNIFGCIRNIAFMHLFATNTVLLVRLFLWESAKDWETAAHIKHNSSTKWEKNELNFTVHSLESDSNSENSSKHFPTHVIHYTSNCWWRVQKSDEIDVISIQNCLEKSTVGAAWSKTYEFLYPIITQYFFLVLCVLYIIWVNFNTKRSENSCIGAKSSPKEAICSRSTKGLFLGVIIFLSSVIILIIYFAVENPSKLVIRILFCIIFVSSSFASVFGIIQTNKMQFRESITTYCEYFFQNVGLIIVYFYGSCNIIAGATSEENLSFLVCLEAVFMMLHASIQNLFLIHLSKKKVDDTNISDKPGRQAVVYLILCNVSLWTLESFVSWNSVKKDIQLVVFSDKVWPLITRIIFPVLIFYRFQAFVSFSKVWKKNYE